jgi:hypothetical protein
VSGRYVNRMYRRGVFLMSLSDHSGCDAGCLAHLRRHFVRPETVRLTAADARGHLRLLRL